MTRSHALTRTCALAALALIALTAGRAPGDAGEEATRVRILLVVDTDGRTPEDVAAEIQAALAEVD